MKGSMAENADPPAAPCPVPGGMHDETKRAKAAIKASFFNSYSSSVSENSEHSCLKVPVFMDSLILLISLE